MSRITVAAPARIPVTTPDEPAVRPPGQVLQLAVAVVEAMTGRRPLHALRPLLAPPAFQELAAVRASGRFMASQLGRLRCQMPTDDAVEISIKIMHRSRWLVCVLRMDRRKTTWGCSEFFVLGA